MNTNKLKAYAPKARIAFMQAVTKRAAQLGLYEDKISDVNIQGDNAIIEGRLFTLKQGQQRNQLVKRIKALGTHDNKLSLKDGFKQFINEIAFTWFNRLTAIRYMEINGYLDHGFRVLSKAENADFEAGFEILAHAADVADDLGLDKSQIVQLMLDGDKEEELYREILLGQCHQLNTVMPFMFEKLDDATEQLLPDNLTKTDSILKALINDLPEENWIDPETGAGQIEVIGWLYQFYISEHKDAVIGKVVKREDIPAATQLFTPNWIVKYLVQNSVGRQWLATYPDSELKDKMEYYITPAEQSDDVIEQLKAITPSSIDPETIKVLDPACGSGHILVEVYELLREIYLERGYRLREIPELILTKNIFGLDIDDRAAQMAAFAVLMKAREDDKRIFSRIADNDLKLNIYSMQSTENLDVNKLWADLDFAEKQQSGDMADMFAEPEGVENGDSTAELSAENQSYLNLLRYLKTQFIDAKNLGSLIEIDSQYQGSLVTLKDKLNDKALSNHQPTRLAVEALLPVVEQAIVLASKYDVAVANPPYMGSKGMNATLKGFAKNNYPNSKSDLFAIFMERVFNFLNETGYNAQVNMQSWMFLSSFQKMRESILDSKTFITMAHLGARAFGQISGEVVQTTAWVLQKRHINSFQPTFFRLTGGNELEKMSNLRLQKNRYDQVTQEDFKIIPTRPLAYWLGANYFSVFSKNRKLGDISSAAVGQNTGNNELYLKNWHELEFDKIKFNSNNMDELKDLSSYWVPYNKGGRFRKWYGNFEHVINWKNDGSRIKAYAVERNNGSHWSRYIQNLEHMCKEGLTWSDVTSGNLSARYLPKGFMFDASGPSAFFVEESNLFSAIATMNSEFTKVVAPVLNSTIHFQTGNYRNLPYNEGFSNSLTRSLVSKLIGLAKDDWDSKEISWDFTRLNLVDLQESTINKSLEVSLLELKDTVELAYDFEFQLNRSFSQTNELDSNIDLDISQITLHANPRYVWGNKSEIELINKLKGQQILELLSYSTGCMMGRYSLDQEGLVYAHSGNDGFKELESQSAYKTFPADDDGIIPLASEEWLFEDDATARFKAFVKTVWGEEHLTENLDFVAESLCLDAIKPKRGEGAMDTIRRYFATKFYKDHLKTYKKRPIYWLFSSGKEKAFECLVYLHRYNESTLARMRTEYVTPLMGKMETQLSLLAESADNASSTAEKNRLSKELKSLQKKQLELRSFDEELKHFAEMKISLDLDDGVKVNYGKFGNLLADVKAIHGNKPEAMK